MFPLIDLHQDLMLYVSQPDLYKDRGQTSFEKIKANNIKVAIVSAFPVPPGDDYLDPVTNELITRDLENYIAYAKTHPEFVIIKSKVDFDRVMATESLFGLILHIEGLNVFPGQERWDLLEKWYALGLRSIGPMWNVNNPFGGGTLDPSRGLTGLGRQLVAWCEKKGVIFDFAHMNPPTFADAAQVVSRPLFVSHGNTKALCPSVRNYEDAQLRKIGESGGVIGVFLSKKFISDEENVTLDAVVDHVNHIANVAGKDAIALGSDFGGILSGFAEGLESLDQIGRLIERVDSSLREGFASKNAARVIRGLLP